MLKGKELDGKGNKEEDSDDDNATHMCAVFAPQQTLEEAASTTPLCFCSLYLSPSSSSSSLLITNLGTDNNNNNINKRVK